MKERGNRIASMNATLAGSLQLTHAKKGCAAQYFRDKWELFDPSGCQRRTQYE
jgi:hypothetical protein